jgi:hypothetical protein
MRVAVRHPQRPDARRRRAAAERAKLKFDFVRFGLRIMVLGGYYFFARLFLFLHRASVHGCSLILCTARASFRVRPIWMEHGSPSPVALDPLARESRESTGCGAGFFRPDIRLFICQRHNSHTHTHTFHNTYTNHTYPSRIAGIRERRA